MANGTEPMGSMLYMTFHFSRRVPGGLLFSTWRVETTGELVGAIFAVFLLAILYEGLKTLREYLVFKDWQNWVSHKKEKRSTQASDNSEDDQEEEEDRTFILANKGKSKANRGKGYISFRYYSLSVTMHLIQSCLHVAQVGFAYLLMLIAMTYNGWLFLAVIFGAGVGYLLFAKSRHLMGNFREQNEHCNH